VYDETALYVAIRAYERDPSAITGQYSSRDSSDELMSKTLFNR